MSQLDDLASYVDKLTGIFRRGEPRSVRVMRMEVPCCAGIAAAARQAATLAGLRGPFEVVTISLSGAVMA